MHAVVRGCAGALPNVISMDGSTPLLLAIKHGKHSAARVLMQHEDTSITLADTAQGLTPLMAACRLADVSMVNALLAVRGPRCPCALPCAKSPWPGCGGTAPTAD